MSETHRPPARNPWIKRGFSIAATVAVLLVLLFIPAGTLAWPLGWLFFLVLAAETAGSVVFVMRGNPELFETRESFKQGTKGWDLVVVSGLFVLLAAIPLVAGLDFRFGWSFVPPLLVFLGYLLFTAAFALVAWAQYTNRFFEPGVRIQTERGHVVVDTGPYARVRHPGYIGASLLVIGSALALGSYWALVPAALTIAGLIYRTGLEEQTLIAELPGYAEYTRRVRYRWIPGIW